MFGKAKRQPEIDANHIEDLFRRLSRCEEDLTSLKRQFALLDAQFEDLIDKAYRKWERVRMQTKRDVEDDTPKKSPRRASILQSAVDKVLER